MDRYDWLLFLHVLAAFAAVASVVVFGVLLAAARGAEDEAPAPALVTLGRRLWDIGGLGTLVLGVALAIDLDGYEIWDGWILAAFVLWAVAGFAGTRVGMSASSGGVAAQMYTLMTIAVAALLIVMIYKPGA